MKSVPRRKRSFILKVKSGDATKSKVKMGANASASNNKSDSDDSIGSASDLRAREEQEEADEKEDSETMTVNDSVMTCGSSAYHAECESMAREELPSQCRRYPRMADLPENKEVDSLFGHSYGERPLLADDELDKGDTISPAPLIDMTDDTQRADHAGVGVTAPKSTVTKDQDVFSMAPFKVLKKRSRDDDDDGQQPDDDFLITMSPPMTEASLVDLDETFAVSGAKRGLSMAQQGLQTAPSKETLFRGAENVVGDNNPFSASFNPPLQETCPTSEDLFGAVPFDRMAVSVSVSNSSRNSNEVDDFISFGTEQADDFGKGYEYPSRTSTASGINNMSFEDLPPGNAADYEFQQASYNKIFFQPTKNNNPFS